MNEPAQKKTAKPGTRPAIGLGPRAVLVADDDPDWRLLVRDVLCGESVLGAIEVYEAEDGHAALEFLLRQGRHASAPEPELLYLDCEMPRVDGFALLKLMRLSPRLRKVPVIMLTGVSDEASMRQAFEWGAAGWIVKPASVADLKRALIASARHALALQQAGQRRRKSRPKWAA